MTIMEFADKFGLYMVVNSMTRPKLDGVSRWSALFRNFSVNLDGNYELGVSGKGETPNEAVAAYAYLLSCKHALLDPMGNRTKITIPLLVYKP